MLCVCVCVGECSHSGRFNLCVKRDAASVRGPRVTADRAVVDLRGQGMRNPWAKNFLKFGFYNGRAYISFRTN